MQNQLTQPSLLSLMKTEPDQIDSPTFICYCWGHLSISEIEMIVHFLNYQMSSDNADSPDETP